MMSVKEVQVNWQYKGVSASMKGYGFIEHYLIDTREKLKYHQTLPDILLQGSANFWKLEATSKL